MMRRVLLMVLALLPWGAAQAGFKVVSPPPQPAVAKATTAPSASTKPIAAAGPLVKEGFQPLDGGDVEGTWRPSSDRFGVSAVTYTGTAPDTIEIRRGMGKDVRLSEALKQIAPAGWRGFGRPDIAETFNPAKTVSWFGGKPWTEVLDRLARSEGLSAEVDWNRKHIYLGKRQVVLAKAAAPIPVAQPWEAKVGSTVHATMEDWTKRAGWMLVWPMNDLDYRVAAPLRFDGSIVDATSKLARLYESAERPLAVDIHTSQKVIVFSEKGAATP